MEIEVIAMERRPTVLVVDDDIALTMSLVFLIEQMGMKGLHAFDAEQALEIIGKNEVDAVISDVNMPGMNGIELLWKIKQYKQEMPVIIMSGYVDTCTKNEALKGGASAVLEKPFTTSMLSVALRNATGMEEADEFPYEVST
jgi:DNA-binding NtrC family response regulator